MSSLVRRVRIGRRSIGFSRDVGVLGGGQLGLVLLSARRSRHTCVLFSSRNHKVLREASSARAIDTLADQPVLVIVRAGDTNTDC